MFKKNRLISLLTVSTMACASIPILGGISPKNVSIAASNSDMWTNGSFPVENFQGYTSPFGYRVSPTGGYSTEFHSGLDFAAPTGSHIRNWWDGRVISVSDDTACGTSVRIQSGSWIHVYCHMQGYVRSDGSGRYMVDQQAGIQIREGQAVVAGQTLGRVGMTGRTTGPHLHWTLKFQGKYVDPAIVLRTMYAAQQQSGRISQTP
jgi:murein DD-endopeptidase MepM/ murein hydrolase activator NlpD